MIALNRLTAWWQLPLMMYVLLPLTPKASADANSVSSRATSEDSVSQGLMSKDFWLWFERYADDQGHVFDPLDNEQLPANLREQQSRQSVDISVERSDVVDALDGASATDDKRHGVIGVFEQ